MGRRILKLGGFRAEKYGMPSRAEDLYYTMMEMGWLAFLIVICLSFVVINVAFGLLYTLLPGAIANSEPGSFLDGFFFSVETLGTVGYGNMVPVTRVGHFVATVEILIGLFFSATMTGLIFARFARPRPSFVFSDRAVVERSGNGRRLMIRLASTRLRPIADVHAQLSWLQKSRSPDGTVDRRLVDLPLVRPHNPQLAFYWTLVHEIEEASPMFEALCQDSEFRLDVTVSGVDTLLANQTLGGETYLRGDILMDHVYEDMVVARDSEFVFDLRRLRSVRPQAPSHATEAAPHTTSDASTASVPRSGPVPLAR